MNGENRTNTNNTHKSKASHSKHLPVLVCTLLAAAALTAGAVSWARSGSETQKAITDSSSSSSLAASQDSSGAKEQEPVTTSATTSAENTQTEIKTRPSHLEAAKPAAVTAAHKTEVKNGITYVDGILIANKTYSLPNSYAPGLDAQAQAAFCNMQQAAAADGIELWICSGYRSYSYQKKLYDNYVIADGKEEADRYSARPGHSEHQTGLAIDVNEPSDEFNDTPAARWLAAHCNEYGFIIRYKPGKESSTGYMAESWHIRYLGDPELCKKIEASGLSLEEYLGITSKYRN